MQLADLHATARQAREREFSSACETSARSTAKLSRSRAANFYAADSRRGFVDFIHGLHQPSRHRSSVCIFPGNFARHLIFLASREDKFVSRAQDICNFLNLEFLGEFFFFFFSFLTLLERQNVQNLIGI